jgi:hypothetical protein
VGYVKRLEQGYYLSHKINPEIVPVLYEFYGPAIYRWVQVADHMRVAYWKEK